jgi:hypothetical protein
MVVAKMDDVCSTAGESAARALEVAVELRNLAVGVRVIVGVTV